MGKAFEIETVIETVTETVTETKKGIEMEAKT